MSNPANDTPTLSVVPDEPTTTAAHNPTPPQPAEPITIAKQIDNYAALTVKLKQRHHLNEGTLVRLIELALNERFTLIQMGLARPTTTPTTEDPNASEDSVETVDPS